MLLFGAWGGVIAHHLPKRSILCTTRAVSAVASLSLGALDIAGTIQLWGVYVTAIILGAVRVFENPARQMFVRQMVGDDRLRNAISLNSTEMNVARVIGPTIAAGFVATVELGDCFVINGLSWVPVIAMLAKMWSEELYPTEPVVRASGQLVEGFRLRLDDARRAQRAADGNRPNADTRLLRPHRGGLLLDQLHLARQRHPPA